MWRHSYRNHVIMAFPSFDTATNSWAPQADITWCAGANRYSEFVRFHDRLTSENEAVDFALRESVLWINEHLKRSPADHGTAAGDRNKVPRALKEKLNRVDYRSRLRLRPPATIFTFNQFKALIAKLGVRDSEQSLHKSYEALVKLREKRHCSWTEIQKKVEQSREIAAARKSQPRPSKRPRLPLTPQAWQRLV